VTEDNAALKAKVDALTAGKPDRIAEIKALRTHAEVDEYAKQHNLDFGDATTVADKCDRMIAILSG
jgi:hypothetical protein